MLLRPMMLSSLTEDLRDATRNLRRSRGFAASAIAILAVGIAASTGLFAVVDAVVLHLSFAGADRIARVRLQPSSGPLRPAMINAEEFLVLRRASTLDGAYIREFFTKTLSGTSFPESVWTEYYTGDALTMLGVQPVLGRVFTGAEVPVGPEPPRVAVLTHRFWQRQFAGQRSAIGQTLRLDGEPFTVIGVIPHEYALDLTDLVVPLRMPPDAGVTYPVHVRVKAGTSTAAAETELQQIYEQFARTRPEAFPHSFRVQLSRVIDEERGASYVPVVALLFAAAGLLLLIGCANVTILLLARGRQRVHEIAIRHALGAGRSRLVSLLLCETLLIALIATVLAVLAVRELLPLLLAGVPVVISQRAARIVVGPAAILFATSLTAIAALMADCGRRCPPRVRGVRRCGMRRRFGRARAPAAWARACSWPLR